MNQTQIAPLKVLGYIRVSTEDQAEKGSSLKAQPEKIRAYCERHGLDLVEVLEDAGESSKTLDRPALREILGRLESGQAGGIVVANLDRLTRHVGDMVRLVEAYFTDAGHQLLSASEAVETRTAAGRMLLYIQIVVSQYQRESSVERTAEIMTRKRSKSERCGNLRFGLTTDATDGRRSKKGNPVALVPCLEDLAVEATIRELRAEGLSYRAIADELNVRGIPSKRGVTRRSTGRWSKSTVAEILTREVA